MVYILLFIVENKAIAGQKFIDYCTSYYEISDKLKKNDPPPDTKYKFNDVSAVLYIKQYFKSKGKSFGMSMSSSRCSTLNNWINNTTELDLSFDHLKNTVKIQSLKPLKEFVHIKKLVVRGHDLKDIHQLRYLQNLEELDLSKNSLDEESISSILNLKNLKILNISENSLGLRWINKLLHLESLVSLDVSNNNIEDIDEKALADHKNILKIDLSKNKLRSFDALRPFIGCRHRLIKLGDNSLKRFPLGYPGINFDWTADSATPRKRSLMMAQHFMDEITLGKNGDLKVIDLINEAERFETIAHASIGAASECNLANFEYIRQNYSGSKKDLYGYKLAETKKTALIALSEGFFETKEIQSNCAIIAQKILRHGRGSLVNDADFNGFTPLHYASFKRSIPLVKIFLKSQPELAVMKNLLTYSLDGDVKKLIEAAIEGESPADVLDIETELERLTGEVVAELKQENASQKKITWIQMICSMVQDASRCQTIL